MKKACFGLILFLLAVSAEAQSWSVATYPDEAGYQERIKGMLQKIADKEFGKRSLAESKCPDTGLPVKVWAVEGEEIISPYTGRKYQQGPTGYFGPKARNEKGEITAFGGDPLKYDLPPATAALLLNPEDQKAKAFLSIPGNLKQQYHFACKNWARFYPLLADKMGDDWKRSFYQAVAGYAESRRPSDGTNREWLPLTNPHNLVGQPGFLLGGNPLDGGTENHKTMWRTSALLYSQLFPDTTKISGVSVKEVEKLTKQMLRDFLKRLLLTGNGEYDSQIYYPHSIEGFLNLYDFSPDEETRDLAKFALDYYFMTYGLKVQDGTIAGAQKRGYLAGSMPNEMELMMWAFFNHTSRKNMDEALTIQQTTTAYRPNKVILNIVNKQVKLPFEARMSRPFYHMDHPHAFAETYYCSSNYAMGNVQMTIVDNPNQQVVWSLVANGTDKPLCFSGGQPMRGSTSGHSPYTQTLQSKGALILLTAPTKVTDKSDTIVAPTYSKLKRDNLWLLPDSEQGKDFERKNRMKYGAQQLHPVKNPSGEGEGEIDRFWNESKGSASSWFYFPRELKPQILDGKYFFETPKSLVAVIPIGEPAFVLNPSEEICHKINPEAQKFFKDYSLLVITGEISGYILETTEKAACPNVEAFNKALNNKTLLNTANLKKDMIVEYKTMAGENLRMKYRSTGLRCEATIDGKKLNWDTFTSGAVYVSPYVSVRDGILKVTDGKDGYTVDFKGERPIYKNR